MGPKPNFHTYPGLLPQVCQEFQGSRWPQIHHVITGETAEAVGKGKSWGLDFLAGECLLVRSVSCEALSAPGSSP